MALSPNQNQALSILANQKASLQHLFVNSALFERASNKSKEFMAFLVVSIRIYDIKNASSSRSGTILSQLKIIVDKMKPLHEMIRSENARTMDEIDFKNKFTARLDEAYNYLRDLKQKSDFFTSVHPTRRPSGK